MGALPISLQKKINTFFNFTTNNTMYLKFIFILSKVSDPFVDNIYIYIYYISRNGMAGSDIGTSTQVRLQQGRRRLWVVLFLSHNARCDDSSCHSTCTLDHLWVRVFSIIMSYPDAY